jgi:hypothetical protein
MKLSSITLFILTLVFGVTGAVAQATISPTKKALITELNTVTGAKQSADEMLESMISVQELQGTKMLESMINDDSTFSAEEKKEILQKSKETSDRMLKRMRDYFSTEFKLGEAMDEISYTLYDKYFTEEELRDLIAFYKSPTGKKTMSIMPKLFADSMALFSEKYAPALQDFVKKAVDAEITQLKKDTLPPKPKPQK